MTYHESNPYFNLCSGQSFSVTNYNLLFCQILVFDCFMPYYETIVIKSLWRYYEDIVFEARSNFYLKDFDTLTKLSTHTFAFIL